MSALARIFPGTVAAPSYIARAYQEDQRVQAWGNLWRDRDFIGRGLRAGGESFAEKSLGDGYHWGMLESPVLWEHVYAFINAIQSRTFDALRLVWGHDDEIDEAGQEEIRTRIGLLTQVGGLGLLTSWFGLLILVAMFAGLWGFAALAPRLVVPFRSLIALMMAFSVVMAVRAMYTLSSTSDDFTARARRSQQQRLGELRLASEICSALLKVESFLLLIAALCFGALPLVVR